MEISGKTKICALIGDPVEHSMSPVMHNACYQKMGLDYVYVPFRVRPEYLAKAVDGFKALNVRGFNVTIPHKVTVIPLLDGLDPLAEKIGAVNTVVNTDGELRGFNTDAEGFLQSLLSKGFKPRGKKVVVVGAGGAARAVSYILAEKGARVTIVNRQQELDWAEDISKLIKEDFKKEVKVYELGQIAQALEKTDLLVNATSVGMSPLADASPVPEKLLGKIPVVFDIVYNPLETRLLREARIAGAQTIGGVDMLVWQGALAFEKWTGKKAPLDLMRSEAVRMLGEYK
jgi:shikimate dehydrogenase